MTRARCPNCGDVYETDFPSREAAVAAGGSAIQREQHQTGICSERCWNTFLGVDERREKNEGGDVKLNQEKEDEVPQLEDADTTSTSSFVNTMREKSTKKVYDASVKVDEMFTLHVEGHLSSCGGGSSAEVEADSSDCGSAGTQDAPVTAESTPILWVSMSVNKSMKEAQDDPALGLGDLCCHPFYGLGREQEDQREWGIICALNPVTSAILDMLCLPDDELLKHTGHSAAASYRAALIRAIDPLWD